MAQESDENSLELCNLLLIDDQYSNLLALEVILERFDFNLVEVTSGQQGLDLLEKQRFALILLDVMMPGMDGFEFIQRARSLMKDKLPPIILVTALASDNGMVAKGYAQGAADYLTKPLDTEEVQAKVSIFVDLFRKNQKLEFAEERLRLLNANLEERAERRARELAASNDRFRIFVESVKDYAFIQLDELGHVTTWNLGAKRIFGYLESEILGKHFEYLLSEIDGGFADWNLQGTSSPFVDFEKVRRLQKKDGTYFWAKGSSTVLMNSEGKHCGYAVVFRDVTERLLAERELRESQIKALEARNAAEAANRAKTIFLANVSHEIRTPLSIVIGLIELLIEDEVRKEERDEMLQIASRNSQALKVLIDDILDLSKAEAGEISICPVRFSLPRFISEIDKTLQIRAKERKTQLKFQLAGPLPQFVELDPNRLRQILLNVVGNAIKFTDGGEVEVEISSTQLSSNQSEKKLSFLVKDSGKGIAPKERSHLFRNFSRGSDAGEGDHGGCGLGLALSRHLARLLDGDVELLESEPGVGSVFEVTVSAKCVDALSSSKDSLGTPVTHQQLLRNVNILLAEDLSDSQIIIQKMLRKSGARIKVVSNGQEAIQELQKQAFDFVLMDVNMPIMDGLEAVRAMRSQNITCPIFTLTAFPSVSIRRKSEEAGANGHFVKPINFVELISSIKSQLPTVA